MQAAVPARLTDFASYGDQRGAQREIDTRALKSSGVQMSANVADLNAEIFLNTFVKAHAEVRRIVTR
jgi:hypothetical protein